MKTPTWSSLVLALISAFGVLLPANESPAVINGTVDTNSTYSAVAWFGGGCSSVLIAPRVMLTSAHCMPMHALQCATISSIPLSVTFAQTGGGWSTQAAFDSRTVAVQGFVQRPELFDLSSCSASDTYGCQNFVDPDGSGPLPNNYERRTIDHSRELVIMYLANDAPVDVTPLPVMVHPLVDSSMSAAEVGSMAGIETWLQSQERVVTTVGFGVGSHGYFVEGTFYRGRDYGLQRWVEVQTAFGDHLGAASCNQLVASIDRPGVLVSPRDLTPAQVGDPNFVAPGADFSPSQHVHSGGGDSGGPVLVGAGIGARGDSPTALPSPSITYDPARNYIVGTASAWAAYGGEFATSFTPTWTLDASTFLMDALQDTDGDGYADPVDDDLDGDGCDNAVDQHPNDRYVPVGKIFFPNCSPSSDVYFGDESLDIEPDGIPNCIDTDDDGDGIDDWPVALDICPVDADQFCFQFGRTCPWNPIFFDCRIGGCFDLLLRLSSLINPDPTQEVFIPVLSSTTQVVTVGPIAGRTLLETVELLTAGFGAGGFATGDVSGAGSAPSFLLLEVVTADGTTAVLAAFDPATVTVGDLDGANALELYFGADGQSVEILGVLVAPVPTLSSGMLLVLIAGMGLVVVAAVWRGPVHR